MLNKENLNLQMLAGDVYNFVKVQAKVMRETEKAIMLEYDVWVPKSQARLDSNGELYISEWFWNQIGESIT